MSQRRRRRDDNPSPKYDLSVCEQEPIHIPGAIQPHGALIAALAGTGTGPLIVTHASANLEKILGISAAMLLGRPLEDAIGQAVCNALRRNGSSGGRWLGQIHSSRGPDGRVLQLNAHRSGKYVCIDIEPSASEVERRTPRISLQSVLETFKHAATCSELVELAVQGLRSIAGYDRVVAYRFGKDGHGEVVAEARTKRVKPFLGQHYPAADLPTQARQQYMRQRVGAVASNRYRPVALIVDRALDDGLPLDLTYSALRSVSPVHREYMRNMGTASSLTIGLSHGEDFWGLLVCHHATRRVASPELRLVADTIGQVVSLLIVSLSKASIFAQRLERNATLRVIVNRLAAPVPLTETLATIGPELLCLLDAAGVIVRFSGSTVCFGQTPPPSESESVLTMLHSETHGDVVAIDNLSLRHPGSTSFTAECSGALILPLAQDAEDVIVWFRSEQLRTVTWAGDPAQHAHFDATTGRPSPRLSFDPWSERVAGFSAPWKDADRELASELRGTIRAEVAQRTKLQLAQLRDHYQELSNTLELKVEQRTRALEIELGKSQKIEASLQQAQKMEAIGQLTGGVAHDFNNVLAAVLGNIDLAQEHATGPVLKRFLQNAQHAAERGAKLTDHLLSFARKQPLRWEPCDLNQLITSFRDLIARTIGALVDVQLALADNLWLVMADATQFEMALLNLAVNARDAMSGGGKLVIATNNVVAHSSGLPNDLAPGDYTCVSVRDTGCGMGTEVACRAFEPFYTTKRSGEGTGLGLSQVYGFSKQLGGSATLSSKVGMGTQVELFIPRALEVVKTTPPLQLALADPLMDLQRSGTRILMVDDEADVRDVTVDVLHSLGFDVVAAENARQGLEILNKDLLIDLLLTDFSMPQMDGIEFIQKARVLNPGLPCLLVTGYAELSRFADALSDGIMILRKPYRMKQLAEAIDRLMAQVGSQNDVDRLAGLAVSLKRKPLLGEPGP